MELNNSGKKLTFLYVGMITLRLNFKFLVIYILKKT